MNGRAALLIFLFFVVMLSACNTQADIQLGYSPLYQVNTMDDTIGNDLQNILDTAVAEYELPAIQAAVIMDNNSRWTGISGTTNYSRKTPAPLNSIFRIASATKLYTAVLAMKLCESGLLDLEQTIDIWYPEIINSDAITVRMLLNHTSGLPDTFEKFSTLLISGLFANRIWKDEELIDRHNEMVYFEPGSEWKYSNANYILLGLIIEKISDLSLEQNFQQHIFEPLKLEETFYRPNENPTPFLLSGFDRSLMPFPNRHKPDQTSWSSLAVGSGAILASAMDMAIFMYALFNGDILEMHTVSQMMDFLPTKDAGENWTGYGLGIVRVNIDGKDYYGHEGLFIGFQSFMLYSPSGNFAIALAANKSQYQQDQVLSDLIKVIE